MSNRDINVLKNNLNSNRIEITDTISQFMEKCNNNFALIGEWGGGPEGSQGDRGEQGVPTKPKVPIHVWKEGKGEEFQYEDEVSTPDGGFEIPNYSEDLRDVKYQEGHLIILENAHVYILENDGGDSLRPKFLLALHSYDPADVINGKNAYVHIAYANTSDGKDGFVTDDELRGESNIPESVSTYGLRRNTPSTYNNTNVIDMPYMGIYSNDKQTSASNPDRYTWVRIQGSAGSTGLQGEKGDKGDKGDKGEKGDKGDNFTGQSYTIDLDGDISTISLSVDRTRLYNDDYCKCTLHSYYGQNNSKLTLKDVTINAPYGYVLNGNDVIDESTSTPIGEITMTESGKDVDIKFTPKNTFVFPESSLVFPIHVQTSLLDTNDKKTYAFNRDTIWTIKGIVSPFELEITPKYRTIKLFESGEYFPENLFVDVYKTIDGKRELFELNDNPSFKLLYKKYDENKWVPYETTGINVAEASTSCLEFKVVRYYGSTDPEKPEEMWDYEDVWVVADGKGTHYYHADLGATESMMVLTTGDKKIVTTEHGEIECAELRSETGYSIVFDPKFYDGTDELTVTDVSIGSNSSEIYYNNGTFVRNLTSETIEGVTKYIFAVTQVPYGIETIPMTFNVTGKCPIYDKDGNIEKYIERIDSISFNVYISTITNTYTLIPTTSTYNTSTGKSGDTIGCSVYKNNVLIPISDLDQNGLKLKYIVYSEGADKDTTNNYTEPLVYGKDDDVIKDEFTASDVAIIFLLEYDNKEIVRSTVTLIKDGIDGEDGNSWQYIFCRSNKFPFNKTGISNPKDWVDNMPEDSNNELLGDGGIADENWFDSPKGVSKDFKYEYQAYRKWDKTKKCWGKYGDPTLYSNYSEDGKGYNVILSNPVAIIPVGDDDWSVNENTSSQTDSTLVYLYDSMSDMSSNNNISISLPSDNTYVKNGNFTITKENGVNKVIFNPVVGNSIFDFQSNAQYKLPITLTYNLGKDIDGDEIIDTFTTTINWTLTPIKGLQDVELFVDKRVVNTSIAERHSLRVGYYLVSSNTPKKFIGNKDEDNINGYKIILTDDIQNLSSGEVSVWENAEYDFVKNGKNRNCYVVLVKSDGKTIVDYINITSINDGKSAIHLELTQDYIAIPCDQNGNIHEKFNGDISSQMILYNGDKVIENNISYTLKIENVDITSDVTLGAYGEIHITNDKIKKLIHGDTNIECIATYNGSSFHKTIFIDFDVLPYEIEMDKNILTRDVNIEKIIDEYLMVRIKYWDGSQGKWIYTDTGNVILNGVNGQENLNFELIPNSEIFNRRLIIESSWVANNNIDTEFKISYYNEKGEELTYETIGIINTGKNGETPSCKKTEIVGYSTENIDVDSTEWKTTLDELGSLSAGQPIYILNEYTWNDGTTSRGITVTLAGTQGVDGKSRVLFYLGSFQDGTLKGKKVEGKLDDERCDYYIDSEGNAWMRTGLDEFADGYPSGSSLDTTRWKASTKVGFLQSGAIHADMINTDSLIADSGFITSLSTNNIFTTSLVADNGFINSLKAKDIIGETIEGKTIKSSNDTWQITNDGGGWLANKTISWNKSDGALVNINGQLNIKNSQDFVTATIDGSRSYSKTYNDDDEISAVFLIGKSKSVLYRYDIIDTDIFGNVDLFENSIFLKVNITDTAFKDKEGEYINEVYFQENGRYIRQRNANTHKIVKKYTYNDPYSNTNETKNYDKNVLLVSVSGKDAIYEYKTQTNGEVELSPSTIIFENGEISTNGLYANDGYFSGEINSNGRFNGTLYAKGEIYDAKIHDSNITINSGNILKSGSNIIFDPKFDIHNSAQKSSCYLNNVNYKNKNISHSYVVSDSKQLGSINIKGSINGKLNIPPITVTTLSYSNRNTPANATSDKLDVNMCILVINEEKNTGTLYDLNRISTTYNGSNWVVGNTGCSHTDTWSFEEAEFDLGNEEVAEELGINGESANYTVYVIVKYSATLKNAQGADYCSFNISATSNKSEITYTPTENHGIPVKTDNTPQFYASDNGFVFISGTGSKLVIDKNGISIYDKNGIKKANYE